MIDRNRLSINDESSDIEEEYNIYDNKDSSDFVSNKSYGEEEINIFRGDDQNFGNTGSTHKLINTEIGNGLGDNQIENKSGKVTDDENNKKDNSQKDESNLEKENYKNQNDNNIEKINDNSEEEYTREKKVSEVKPFSIYTNFMKKNSKEKLEEKKIFEIKKKPKYEISSNSNNFLIKKKNIFEISPNQTNLLIKKKNSEKSSTKTISDSSLKTISDEIDKISDQEKSKKIVNRNIMQAFSLIQMKNDISIDDSSEDESYSMKSESDNSDKIDKNNEIKGLEGHLDFSDEEGSKEKKNIEDSNENRNDNNLKKNSEKNDFEDLSNNFDSDLNEKNKMDSITYSNSDTSSKDNFQEEKKKYFFKKLLEFVKKRQDIIKQKTLILMSFYEPEPELIFINKIRKIVKKKTLFEKEFLFHKILKFKKIKKGKLISFQDYIYNIFRKKIFKTIKEINKQYKYYKFLNAFTRIIKIYKYNILIDGFMRINYLLFLDPEDDEEENEERNFSKKKQIEIYQGQNLVFENKKLTETNNLENFQSNKHSIKEIQKELNQNENFPEDEYENSPMKNLYEPNYTQKNLYQQYNDNISEKESRVMGNVNDSVIDNSLCINSYLEKENKEIEENLKKKFETEESNIEIDLNDKIGETHINENIIGTSSGTGSGNPEVKDLVGGLKNFLEDYRNTKKKCKNKKIKDEIFYLKDYIRNINKKKKNNKMRNLLIEIIRILEKLILKKKKYEKRKIYDDTSYSSESNNSYIKTKKISKVDKLLKIINKLSIMKREKNSYSKRNSKFVNFFLVFRIILEQKIKKIKKDLFINLKNKYKNNKAKEKLLYLGIKYKNYLKKNFPNKLKSKKKKKSENKKNFKKVKDKIIDKKLKKKKKGNNLDNKLLKSVCFADNDLKSNLHFRTNTNCNDDILFLQLEEEYMEKVTKRNSSFTSILGYK